MHKKSANWMWYPGDYEIMRFNKNMSLRYQREFIITPFWKLDNYYPNVKFKKSFTINRQNTFEVKCEGEFNVFVEQVGYMPTPNHFVLEAGSYDIYILVNNNKGLPCAFLESEDIKSGKGFTVTCQDHQYLPVGYFDKFDSTSSPNNYSLSTRQIEYKSVTNEKKGKLFDFGKQIVAYVKFDGISDGAKIDCCFGESVHEALDKENCEQVYHLIGKDDTETTAITKAFKYIYVECSNGTYENVSALLELTENNNLSSFESSDKQLKDIWDTSIHTLDLNTREFFLDGAKRDRWTWSGDVYQSAILNYYCFNNFDVVKRSIIALGGKEKITTHINHIMDYTLFWLLTISDYYTHSQDKDFLFFIFPRMTSYIEFCLGRRNDEGFLYHMENDWVFVDWAEMDNRGEVSFEQLLFVKVLLEYSEICKIIGVDGEKYKHIATDLLNKTFNVFFKNGVFYHSRIDGKLGKHITKYANIIAIIFGFVKGNQADYIAENILLNDSVQKITTPYMMFYEMEALCTVGRSEKTLQKVKDYWGGMLNEGATTFWETYDPLMSIPEHYAMYDRPYGKSLCHAWGASPIYIIAGCILGIKLNNYGQINIKPCLHIFQDFNIIVPIGKASVDINKVGNNVTINISNGDAVVDLQKNYKATSTIDKEDLDSFYRYHLKNGQTLSLEII